MRMYTEETLKRELREIYKAYNTSTSKDELAFLDGALFALQWMKTGIRSMSPGKYIQWRQKRKNPYSRIGR